MHTARTTTAVAALAAAALLTAGCTSDDGGGSDSKPSPTATPSASPEKRFLDAVHDAELESWTDKAPTDERLIEYPPQWCAELDAGHSVEYLFDDVDGAALYPVGMDWGTKEEDANELLVMGVTAYCPEHRAQVTKELREDGGY